MQTIPIVAMFLLSMFALFFGIWTAIGLFRQMTGKAPERPKKRKVILGVCADFSSYVGIPLWLVRFGALIYAPWIVGILFYLLYYWMMKHRTPRPKKPETKTPANITKMDIHRY